MAKGLCRLARNLANGRIAAEELTAIQQDRGGKRGMGRGHHGAGPGMPADMGPRYQALDAESKENKIPKNN